MFSVTLGPVFIAVCEFHAELSRESRRWQSFRAPLRTSRTLQNAIAVLRDRIPALEDDRFLSGDLTSAAELVKSGEIVDVCGIVGTLLESVG